MFSKRLSIDRTNSHGHATITAVWKNFPLCETMNFENEAMRLEKLEKLPFRKVKDTKKCFLAFVGCILKIHYIWFNGERPVRSLTMGWARKNVQKAFLNDRTLRKRSVLVAFQLLEHHFWWDEDRYVFKWNVNQLFDILNYLT